MAKFRIFPSHVPTWQWWDAIYISWWLSYENKGNKNGIEVQNSCQIISKCDSASSASQLIEDNVSLRTTDFSSKIYSLGQSKNTIAPSPEP